MKQQIKYVAVILVYRNVDDLVECVESFYDNLEDCRIIVVNSFYDESSKMQIEAVANKYYCDFLNVENKGYSYGNNCGMEYANEHYNYDYIIISNPDTVVKKFEDIESLDADIIAPKIIARSGRNQNPMHVFDNRLSEFIIYHAFKCNSNLMLYAGIGINKILRELTILVAKIFDIKNYKIHTAHGSFVILSAETMSKMGKVYDEHMFLFAEEGVLAFKAKELGFKTVYTESVEVMHKEDGSMKLSDFSMNDALREANIYYYETYRMKN